MAHWCLRTCASIAHATVRCACHIACNSVESNSLQDPEIDLSLSLSIHRCQKFTHGPWCSWKLRPSTKCCPSWYGCIASIASGSCIVAQSPCFAEWRRSGHWENFDANGTNRTSLTQWRLGTYFGTAAHTHTYYCRCEFCCGMHLTCKNNPVTPDRNGSVRGPGKHWEATIAIARKLCQLVPGNQTGWLKFMGIRLAGFHTHWLDITKMKWHGNRPWTTGNHNYASALLDVSSDILRTLQRALLSGALQSCPTPLQSWIAMMTKTWNSKC